MKTIFICPHCGHKNYYYEYILPNGSDELAQKKVLCQCGKPVEMKHNYPNLQIIDFIETAFELYRTCKNTDKKNIEAFLNFAKEEKVDFTREEVMQYIEIDESIIAKYVDNDLSVFTDICDELKNRLKSRYKDEVDYYKIDYFVSCDTVFFRNKFRKAFIIVVASIIEMLFDDFFRNLILTKLGTKGGNIFLSRYGHSGVKECLDICDAFMDKPLKFKMDNIKKGFFDKWNTLRNERNSIIHSNTKYISSKRTNYVYKLIDESVDIFTILISEVYSQNNLYQ
ncbi:hypothetical protein DVW08_08695 [Clostridium botulinum]|nr:hypothetical protein [Clostridium botulinum]